MKRTRAGPGGPSTKDSDAGLRTNGVAKCAARLNAAETFMHGARILEHGAAISEDFVRNVVRSLGSSPKVVGSVASEWHLGLGWVGVMVAFFRVTYYVNTYAYTHNVRNVRTVELRRTAANGSHAVRAIFAQITTCWALVRLLLGLKHGNNHCQWCQGQSFATCSRTYG